MVDFKYSCKICTDINLCYKCHDSRHALHPRQHPFAELGLEFGRGLFRGGSGSSRGDESDKGSDSEESDEVDRRTRQACERMDLEVGRELSSEWVSLPLESLAAVVAII